MAANPWIKLWLRWYESASHLTLSPEALHTGPHLLILASKWGRQDDGSAWLLGPHGDPLTLEELARHTRWSKSKVKRILNELEAVRTMVKEGDRWGFPKFAEYQESASASRVRKHRKRKGNVTVGRYSNGDRNGPVATEGEGEAEGEDRSRSTPPPPAAPPVRVREARPASQIPTTPDVSGFAHEWRYRWETLKGELGKPHLQNPITASGQKAEGLMRALGDQGPQVVAQVIEHTAREVAGGRLPAPLLGRMFIGDGFGARLEAWSKHQDEQDRRRQQQADRQRHRSPQPQAAEPEPTVAYEEPSMAERLGLDPATIAELEEAERAKETGPCF